MSLFEKYEIGRELKKFEEWLEHTEPRVPGIVGEYEGDVFNAYTDRSPYWFKQGVNPLLVTRAVQYITNTTLDKERQADLLNWAINDYDSYLRMGLVALGSSEDKVADVIDLNSRRT